MGEEAADGVEEELWRSRGCTGAQLPARTLYSWSGRGTQSASTVTATSIQYPELKDAERDRNSAQRQPCAMAWPCMPWQRDVWSMESMAGDRGDLRPCNVPALHLSEQFLGDAPRMRELV